MEEEKGRGKDGCKTRNENEATVTVGMSWLEISKQKVFEIEWNENVWNDR